jgi:outer membrane receptor for ferrienterochelin and colicins
MTPLIKQLLLILFSLTLSIHYSFSQLGSVKGHVSCDGQPIEFASVGIIKLNKGTTTNGNGGFELKDVKEGSHEITVSCIGYETYTTFVYINVGTITTLTVKLKETITNFNSVVITGTQKEVLKMESPIPVEIYTPTFFKKNSTPSIFEALTGVNGVQPQLNCNVCNTGDIHINGMEGPYTMVLIDGMPIVSSLSTVYGLSGIPNSLVKRIEIVKGPSSTLYGSEAVGGVINIITKDAGSSPLLMLDMSATSLKEYSADVSTKFKVKNGTSLLGVNGFWFNTIRDINHDRFTDFTLQKRLSVFNKWDLKRKSNRTSSAAFRYLYEYRWGGQTHYAPKFRGTDSVYAESIYTNRIEMIGKYQLPVKSETIFFDYSYNYHLQNSYYGVLKYLANQHTAFAQLRWDKKIKRHDFIAGLPFRFIHYDDNTPATTEQNGITNMPQSTYLPGIFAQDELKINSKLTTLLGLRYDYNTNHGSIYTPRVAFKYMPNNTNTFRLSGGNGYRVVNFFTEDHAALTGSRNVVIKEALKPEKSWNTNLNYTGIITHKKGYINLDASIFYTYFSNKIVGDFMTDPNLILYTNLNGNAISKGITLNFDMSFKNKLKLIGGVTFMDVYQNLRDSANKSFKIPQQFAPKISGNIAISYNIPKIFIVIDVTSKINGPMYLPVVPNDFRPEQSPWFAILNIQFSKRFTKGIETYLGVKNILNFIPKDPILRPFDPFDKHITIDNPNGYTFDPSYNYAPVQGTKVLIGLRYNLY